MKLSPTAAALLEELRPVLGELAAAIVDSAVRKSAGLHVEQGAVVDIDRTDGTAVVLMDSGNTIPADTLGSHVMPGERCYVVIVPPHGPFILSRTWGTPGLLGFGHTDVEVDLTVAPVTAASALVVAQSNRLIEVVAHVPRVVSGDAQRVLGIVTVDGVEQGQVGEWTFGAALEIGYLDGHVHFVSMAGAAYTVALRLFTSGSIAACLASPGGSDPGPITLTVKDIGSTLGL